MTVSVNAAKIKMKCILLIDDDHITNFINERLIKQLEIAEDVVVMVDTEKALLMLKDYSKYGIPFPDIILLDLNLPCMNGFNFYQELQKLAYVNNTEIKVVVLTNSTRPIDRISCSEYGIKHMFQKPLTKEILFDVLN